MVFSTVILASSEGLNLDVGWKHGAWGLQVDV